MSTPEPHAAPSSPGDDNVERLLREAYQPEAPATDFVRRVNMTVIAEAQVRARLAIPRKRGRVRDRLIPVAAGVTLLAMCLQFLPRNSHSTVNDRRADNTNGLSTPTVPAPEHLTARPATPSPAASSLGIGSVLRTEDKPERFTLPDGSTLFANRDTVVSLEADRRLKLARGDIFVEVEPRENQASEALFVVATPDREITALGTRFVVRAEPAGTGVIVTQGKVRVSGVESLVLAGQQLAPGAQDTTPAPQATTTLEWTKELLAAAESPLVPASQYAGGALVALDPNGQEARLSLRKYHIDVHIEDGFARTTIDQTYFNHEYARLEGRFYFPLPPDASLSRLAMYVDGRLMEGGMAERDHARNVFETIMYTKRDPALLEWVDGSTFSMRVFPLEGRQEKRIILSYTQRLDAVDRRTRYRFPAGHSLDFVRDWSFHGVIKNGAGLRWQCPSHPDMKAQPAGNDLVLDLAKSHVKIDKDVAVQYQAPHNTAVARFASAELDGSRYLMLRYQPKLAGRPKRARRDWIFLFESSGDRDPLLARVQIDVIRTLLDNAEHDDSFTILSAGTRVSAFADKPLPVTPANIQKAVTFLNQVHLIGALDLGHALKAAEPFARAGRNPCLVHVGSGIAALGEIRANELVRRLPPGIAYVGVGVGKRWDRAFMKSAAEATNGYCTQINPDESITWRAFELSAALDAPRLLGIKVIDNAEKAHFLYHATTLVQGEELCAIARIDAGQPMPDAVTVTGNLDGKPFQTEFKVRDVAGHAGYLPRTWAKLEIDRLLADDAEKNKAKIVALSKAMYVMSPYTSLLVLENDAMYTQYHVDRGRKDHWAMYPCPDHIPVVTEALTLAKKDELPAPGQRRPVADVLKSIVVHETPLFFADSITFGLTDLGRPWTRLELEAVLSHLIQRQHSVRAETSRPSPVWSPLGVFQRPSFGGGFGSGNFGGAMGFGGSFSGAGFGGFQSWNGNFSVGFSGGFGGLPGGLGALGGTGFAPGGAPGFVPFGTGAFTPRSFRGHGLAQQMYAPVDLDGSRAGSRNWTNAKSRSLASRATTASFDLDNLGAFIISGNDAATLQQALEALGKNAPQQLTIGVLSDKDQGPVTPEELARRGAYFRDIPGLISKLKKRTIRWPENLTYQRSSFSNDERIFTDLLAFPPGMNTTATDIEAVLDAEAKGVAPKPGTIDPGARRLIERARSAGWQTVTIGEPKQVGRFTITINGQGQFAYERTLPTGLREHVVCDGKTLLHLYPEIGVGAKRTVSAYHRADLQELVPWFVPPAEDLARGADVRLLDESTVEISTGADREVLLVFNAADGRLEERRLIEKGDRFGQFGRALYRENYGPDGLVRVYNEQQVVIAEHRLQVARASQPNLSPDNARLVVLSLPYRHANPTADLFERVATLKTNGPLARYLAYFADAKRSGAHMPIGDLGGPANGFLQTLAQFHDLYYRWSSKQILADQSDAAKKARAAAWKFINECPSLPFAWALLDLVQRSYSEDFFRFFKLTDSYDALLARFEALPALRYAARYEKACNRLRQGNKKEAAQLFRELYASAFQDGELPPIDKTFRAALEVDDPGPGGWHGFLRAKAATLIDEHRPIQVFHLVWQSFTLGDGPLADDLASQALAGAETERTAIVLSAAQYFSVAGQTRRAETLLQSLTSDPSIADRPDFWFALAHLIQQRDGGLEAVPALEKAVDLEYRKLPDVVNLAAVRQDYGQLLSAYEQLVGALANLPGAKADDLPARVVRTADRWRSLDPDATAACQAAARALAALGQSNLAWEYLTTPLARQSRDSAGWLNLAHELQDQGSSDLADRAYMQAFEREPTNPQLLWDRAQNLLLMGRRADADGILRQLADGSWQPRFRWLQDQARQMVQAKNPN